MSDQDCGPTLEVCDTRGDEIKEVSAINKQETNKTPMERNQFLKKTQMTPLYALRICLLQYKQCYKIKIVIMCTTLC